MPQKYLKDNASARHARKKRQHCLDNNLCIECHQPESVTGKKEGPKCEGCREKYLAYARERAAKIASSGKCIDCGGENPTKRKRCDSCRAKKINRSRDAKKNFQCIVCLGPLDILGQTRCSVCRNRGDASWHARQKAMREKCFEAYGGAYCSCCYMTDKDFLTFDHIAEDGGDRRKADRSHRDIYRWLIKNNFPKDIRVMCIGCNWVRTIRGGGVCPHEKQTKPPFTFIA